MRIGLMIHMITVYRFVNSQSRSGEVSKVRTKICDLRCQLLKQKGYYTQNDIEKADHMTLVFETWYNDLIKDSDIIEYNNQEFKIVLIEKDIVSRTMKLHVQKTIK